MNKSAGAACPLYRYPHSAPALAYSANGLCRDRVRPSPALPGPRPFAVPQKEHV